MAGNDLLPLKRVYTNEVAGEDVTTTGVSEDVTVSEILAGSPATEEAAGTVLQMPVQNPAAAADVAALKTQFDALLTKLKDAGLMATS